MFPKNRKKSLIEKDSQALWLFCLFWLCGVTQLGQRLLQGLFIFYIYPHKVTCSKDRNPPAQCYRAMLQLKHHRCYCQFLAEQFSIWYCHCKSKLKKKAITGRTLLQICVRDVHVWDVHVCMLLNGSCGTIRKTAPWPRWDLNLKNLKKSEMGCVTEAPD